MKKSDFIVEFYMRSVLSGDGTETLDEHLMKANMCARHLEVNNFPFDDHKVKKPVRETKKSAKNPAGFDETQDYKSTLNHKTQAEDSETPRYSHSPEGGNWRSSCIVTTYLGDDLVCEGIGANKKKADQLAAYLMLTEVLPEYERSLDIDEEE